MGRQATAMKKLHMVSFFLSLICFSMRNGQLGIQDRKENNSNQSMTIWKFQTSKAAKAEVQSGKPVSTHFESAQVSGSERIGKRETDNMTKERQEKGSTGMYISQHETQYQVQRGKVPDLC
jgi:hypothetical protein